MIHFQKKSGVVLIISVLVLTTLLMVGSYLISITTSENKISNVQSLATENYYLAEAGVSDMIWKIQNDINTRSAFLTGTLSAANDISRTNVFGDPNASYVVQARNTVTAEAWITATSTYTISGNVSQRVVKSYISKATGTGTTWDYSVFAGGRGSQQNGNFTFTGSGIVLTSNGGRLHSNQVFKVQGAEVVVNDGMVTSSNVINVVAGGKLTLNNSTKQAPTTTVDILQIDFNSASPDSWKNRATKIFSPSQFKNLANNTTLNGIIYVTGDAQWTGKNLTINGVLVTEGDAQFTMAGNNLTVNADSVYGGGILAEDDFHITSSGGTILINGMLYSGADLILTSAGTNFTINGSMVGFDAKVTASGGSIILNYTPENFQPVIDPTVNQDSPIIQIDHWEEQY